MIGVPKEDLAIDSGFLDYLLCFKTAVLLHHAEIKSNG